MAFALNAIIGNRILSIKRRRLDANLNEKVIRMRLCEKVNNLSDERHFSLNWKEGDSKWLWMESDTEAQGKLFA